MKAEEFKGKTPDELNTLILDLKKQQFNLRFQRSQGQLENTAQMRAVRKDIARAKTFLGRTAPEKADGAEKKAKAAAKPKKAAAKTKKAAS